MATQLEIAKHLDLSKRRVADLLNELDLPTKGCDLDTARIAYIRKLRGSAAGRSTESELDYAAEKTRLTHHQANITQLDEEIKRGSLIPAETVEVVWSDMIASFRAKILAVPTKAAHQFVGLNGLSEIQNALKEHLYEALNELSEYEPEQYGGQTD